jgi:lipopolysaccharide export LptBFGC system permease protein LptF
MRLLDRYLLRELLSPLAICLSGFSLFWIAFDLFSHLEDFQKASATKADVAEFYLVGFPTLLITIVPIGFLLALLYALTNHARHHELTAIRAAGVSLWRICVPYFAVGLILSGSLFALNEMLVPNARESQDYLLQRRLEGVAATNRLIRSSVNFLNERSGRAWGIGRLDLGAMELQELRMRLPIERTAWREVRADSARWTTNAGWRPDHLTEELHRSADDPEPAKLLGPGVDFPQPPPPFAITSNWPGQALVFSNGWLKTNLVFSDPSPGGARWSAAWWNPSNQELHDIEVRLPLGPGAQRQFFAKAATWDNQGWLFADGQEYIFRYARDRTPFPVMDVKRLAELDETPAMIRSEVRVTSFSLSKALKHPELSLEEILLYRKLHPVLRPDMATWLDTQFQAHLAAPWTCLVVALIAAPFGAPSGRRNVFFGVAGSIALGLVYFVLQRLGFAMGQNGSVPPWLGAWLPNLAFAAIGLIMMARVR